MNAQNNRMLALTPQPEAFVSTQTEVLPAHSATQLKTQTHFHITEEVTAA